MSTYRTVPALICEQALTHPDRTAAEAGDQRLTFGRLVHKAEKIASRLRAAGVTREEIVACCVPRGVATLTTALGVWLATGALLPIDPTAPPTRTEHMLRDSGAKVAILDADQDAAVKATFAKHVDTILTVDMAGAITAHAPDITTSDFAGIESQPTDLAYVVYTSGTTGLPKGVLVEHGGLANMAAAHESVLHPAGAAESRRTALNAIATTDTFFSDLVNLAAGRTLVIVDESTRRDPERLARFLVDRRIDVFDGTPTQVRMLLLGGFVDALQSLKVLIVGNEPTDPQLWSTLRSLPGVRVHNFYGPTECTVDVTSAALSENETPVIGRPLPGCEIRLVDAEMRPVADGEVGEICITGTCVARGYLHPSDADAARFVHLLSTEPGGPTTRAYLTGDKARHTPSGQLEFLGRVDDQVKIAGYRVEPREIEAALRSCDEVLDAAVGVRDRAGAASLAAWAVLVAGVSADEVIASLRMKLPYYMIPRLTRVPSVPMGPSGKADIDALLQQAPDDTASESPSDTTSVATPGIMAEALSAIWCGVLGIDSVNATDDFFAVGGDSLKATRMIVAVREAITPAVPIRTIFDNSVFGAFVGAISQKVEI